MVTWTTVTKCGQIRTLLQSNDSVEEFLRTVFGFLKRNSTFMAQEGAEKKIAKIARDYQPKTKVPPPPPPSRGLAPPTHSLCYPTLPRA